MSARRFRARRPWCALLVVPLVGCGASSKPEVMAPQGAPAEAMVAPAAAAPAAAAMADETPAASPGVAPAAQASVPSAVQPSAVPQAPPPGPHAPQAPATATPAKGTTGAETRARSAKEIAPAKGMVEQRIIFTGTLDVEVEGEAIGKTLHDVIDIAVERGGYIAHLFNAVEEGGPKNGVLTAVEDYLKETSRRFVVARIPAAWGLAILLPVERAEACPEARAFVEAWQVPEVERFIERLEMARIAMMVGLAPSGRGP